MQLKSAPILETERLVLRPYRLKDFEAFSALYFSQRSKYMDGPISESEAWGRFAAGAGRWSLVGYGPWTIERQSDQQSVGIVSLNYPLNGKEKELGWALWEGCEGQGYAYEAASKALGFALESLGWRRFVSYISAPNTASIKLAERLGATLDSTATQKQAGDTLVFRHSPITTQ